MMNLNKAVELTQRRKGAETQGFRLLGRGLNAKTQRRSPAEPEIRSPQGGGRSSFASGDSFRAAHLTAETRRAQRRKPSPASFLCALRVSAVKFPARDFLAACEQLRLDYCSADRRSRKSEVRRGAAKFFRERRVLASGPFNRRDAKSLRRKPSPAAFLRALRVSAVKFPARDFSAACEQFRR